MKALVAFLAILVAQAGWSAPTKWALVVGVDKYDQSARATALQGAGNDAAAIAKTLIDRCGFPSANVQLLTSKSELQPSSTEILVQLENLARNAGPEDTVMFFFAGHGVSDDAGNSYLLPSNVDMRTSAALTHSAIRTSEIQGLLNGLKAKTVILIFDMCRTQIGVTGRTGERALPASPDAIKDLSLKDDGKRQVVSLFGCSPNQRSFEWGAKARGYFSWYLEQGLKGEARNPQGMVTIASLVDYISKEVPKAVRDRESAEQTPYVTIGGPNPNAIVLSSGFGVAAPTPDPSSISGTLSGERASHAILKFRTASAPTQMQFQLSGVEENATIRPMSTLKGDEVKLVIDGASAVIDPKAALPYQPEVEFDLGAHQFAQLDLIIKDKDANEFVTRVILTRGRELSIDAILTKPDTRVPAQANMRQLATGIAIYLADYDDVMPAAADTYTLFAIVSPYFKQPSLTLSMNPNGGRILYNTNLANVNSTAIEEPSNTPMLWDSLPWPDGKHLVAFTDSSVRFIDEAKWQSLAKYFKPMWGRINKFVPATDGQRYFREQMKGRNNVHDPP